MTEKKNKTGKVFKTVILILVPLVFIGLMGFFISNFLGFNALNYAENWAVQHHIPIASKKTLSKKVTSKTTNQTTIRSLQQKMNQQASKLKQEQQQLNQKNSQITQLQSQIKQLQSEAQAVAKQKAKKQATTAVIAATYSNMDPGNAAAILSKMKDADALNILKTLGNDVKAKILEKMPVDKAASLSLLLAKSG